MKKFIATLALISTCSFANASLIAAGDQVIDTVTGHSWFKVSETLGYSYNQMLTQFSTAGSRYFGYQYGTTDDFVALMVDGDYPSPVPFISYDNSGGNQVPVANMTDLFGLTAVFSYQTRTDGWLDATAYNEPLGIGFLVNDLPTYSSADYLVDFPGMSRDITFTDGFNVGSWIFKSEAVVNVPEPSSIALLTLGLLGFALSRKQRK